MKLGSELIVDQNGIELGVEYEYEMTRFFEDSYSFVLPMVYTDLKSVTLTIDGRDIEILPLLHENEKEKIIDLLTYEQ